MLPLGPAEKMPLLLNEHCNVQGKAETEYASGGFLNRPGSFAEEKGVTTQIYSNKWAIPTRLKEFLEQNWGGLVFASGYDVYPDHFPKNASIDGVFNILSVSKNLWLNPPGI